MTRSQRHKRNRNRKARLGLPRDPFAAGIFLAENPSGQRHAARLTGAFLTELADAERKAYAPLTVATRFLDSRGRKYPDRRTEHGTPSRSSYSVYTV